MSEELSGNVLILQCGEPTIVCNAILAGAITESLNHDVIEEVYGVLGGFQGILKEEFIDLAERVSRNCSTCSGGVARSSRA